MASLRKISGNYYAYFYDRHRQPKEKSVPLRVSLKSAAKKRLKYLESLWAEGDFDPWADDAVVKSSTQSLTVADAVQRFLEDRSDLRPRTLDTYRQQLDAWTDGHTPPGLRLQDVSTDHLRPYIRQASISNASMRKRYRHLRALLNWAVQENHLSASPLNDVRQPKEQKKQAAFLSTDDLEVLLRCIDAHYEVTENAAGQKPDDEWLRDMIEVAVCTGLRRSELCRLRWQDVDLRHRLLTVRSRDGGETKSGHERQLPLRGDGLDVMHRRQAALEGNASPFVFTDRRGLPIKPDRATKRFKFFVRKAKLPDRDRLRFHSLRHTCGSWLAMKGVPMKAIQSILGHSTMNLTSETYAHLNPDVLARAMEETFE